MSYRRKTMQNEFTKIQRWTRCLTTNCSHLSNELDHSRDTNNCMEGKVNTPFFLGHPRMDADWREVALAKQLIQFCSSANTLHKYHNLVEIKSIQQIVQFPVLLCLAKFYVVLHKKWIVLSRYARQIKTCAFSQRANNSILTCTRPWRVNFASSST